MTRARAAVVLLGAAVSDARTVTRAGGYRLLLVSNRDGQARGYSMHADGSQLTPLLPRARALLPTSVSQNGRVVAYADPRGAIYVSRASGAGLRRIVRKASGAALSRDGKLLAFSTESPSILSIVRTDGRGRRRLTSGGDYGGLVWAPDGKALVFSRSLSDELEAIVLQPLRGKRRTVVRGWFLDYDWSPDGRWIAYVDYADAGSRLYVIHPSGAGRRLVARGIDTFAWSPNGRRLATRAENGEIAVVGVDGRGKRLGLRSLRASDLSWSPDGRRLALAAGDPTQIWLVGIDGRRLRRLTSGGQNRLVGWTRLAPVLPSARRMPPTERVAGPRVLALRAPVEDLAADGPRVAFIARRTQTDCDHVAVWTPGAKSLRRFWLPAPCAYPNRLDGVALGGTRVVWSRTSRGRTSETDVTTATLARPAPVGVAHTGFDEERGFGLSAGRLVGDQRLLVFAVERTCDPSSYAEPEDACPAGRTGVEESTVYRIDGARPREIATADGPLSLLAVDAGRVVVALENRVRVLSAGGAVLRDVPVKAAAAALSGNRLALRAADAVELYDVGSGRLVSRVTVLKALRLLDLEGDILVTASGGAVTLRRLADGRTTTFRVGGTVHAQLERPGLFVSGPRWITFTPMRELLRRLDG